MHVYSSGKIFHISNNSNLTVQVVNYIVTAKDILLQIMTHYIRIYDIFIIDAYAQNSVYVHTRYYIIQNYSIAMYALYQ